MVFVTTLVIGLLVGSAILRKSQPLLTTGKYRPNDKIVNTPIG